MYRWLILPVLLSALAVSGYHRARARSGGGTVARRREGFLFLAVRGLMALTLFGGLVAHVVKPDWMRWASFDAHRTLRWVGFLLSVLTIPAIHWVLSSLGRNVTETVLTKGGHELIMEGPYRWIRHPLYSTGLVLLFGLGLLAGSWFVLLATIIAFVLLRALVIPREEQALLVKFGERYQSYISRTGRLVPRWRGTSLEVALLLGIVLVCGCSPRADRVFAAPGLVTGSSGAQPGYDVKLVRWKEPPSTVIGDDGSLCRLTPERYAKVEVGDWLGCEWTIAPDSSASPGDSAST